MRPTSAELFVGRAWELAHLRSALNGCRAGRGRLFLITGEAGIGKTSFVRKVADMAEKQGFHALWGRCWEGGETPAFWPWTQVLRNISPAGVGGPLSHDITDLVPGLKALSGSERSEHDRILVFDAATRYIQTASAERPLVIVIEDLHEADRSSLKLLDFLARQIHTNRLMVLATSREPEMHLSPQLAEDLASIMRLGHQVPLRGLRVGDVGQLLAQGFDIVLSEEELAAIQHKTDGNPFYIDEIAREVVTREDSAEVTPATLDVPEGLKSPIRRSLASLAKEDRELLEVAAVIGREFSFDVLTSVVRLTRGATLQRLGALAARRLVDPGGFGIGPYRFSHALVRETIYRDLADDRRCKLHARVGRAFEKLHGSEPDRHIDHLAHHFFQAAVLGDGQRALEYSKRAGFLAARRLGFDEAVDHFRRALELNGDSSASLRIDLLLAIGDAQWWAGRPIHSKESFQEAVREARARKDANRLAEGALRVGETGYGGAYTQAWTFDPIKVDLLEEAVAALAAEQSALRVRVCARLATALYFAPFDTATKRETLSAGAVQLARQLGEPATLAYALNARHLAVWGPDNLEERLSLSGEIVDLARTSGEFGLELTGLAWRISNLYELGDADGAHREIAAYCALADRLGYPYFRATALMFRATQAIFRGDLTLAEELSGKSKELGERFGDVNIRLSHYVQMAVICDFQGRPDEGAAYMELVTADHPPELQQLINLAGLCRLGLPLSAKENLAGVWEARNRIPGAFWLSNLAGGMTVIAAAAGSPAKAAEIYDMVLPYAHRWILPGRDAVAPCGTVDYYLGILAASMNRIDEAAGHFRSAADAAERAGSPPFAATARAAWGAILVRRGGENDLGEGAGLLAAAAETAEKLNLQRVMTEVQAARSQLEAGASASPRVPARGTTSVMRCEGDYWTIVFDDAVSRVKDSKGMRYLKRLLAAPGREFHVLDLAAGDRPSELQPLSEQFLLDPVAKAAYRARLVQLDDAIQEAEDFNDLERASLATAEKDALLQQLASSVGLGGRDRRERAPAERARSAVSKSIRSSLQRIDQSNPRLGAHLAVTIRTGYFCSYVPDPRVAVSWTE